MNSENITLYFVLNGTLDLGLRLVNCLMKIQIYLIIKGSCHEDVMLDVSGPNDGASHFKSRLMEL